jgi:hypothetical protein
MVICASFICETLRNMREPFYFPIALLDSARNDSTQINSRNFELISYFDLLFQSRIQCVSQSFTQKIINSDCDKDRQSRKDDKPPCIVLFPA